MLPLIQQDMNILYIGFKRAFGFIDHLRLLVMTEDLGYPSNAVSLLATSIPKLPPPLLDPILDNPNPY